MTPSTTPQANAATSTVTVHALKQRINRKLRHEGEVLKTTRGQRWCNDLGDHYVIDLRTNSVLAQHVDLEGLGSGRSAC